MPLTPDSYDRLRALYKRFDDFPEARFLNGGGVELQRNAYLAWLDSRKMIEELASEIFHATKGWRPIAKFFDDEQDGPCVLLWAVLPETGEPAVTMGYYDPDERVWYRQGCGADLESEPLQPTKFMALAELMRSADDREFVAIPRMHD